MENPKIRANSSKTSAADANHHKRMAQIWEVVCVLALTFGLVLIWQGIRWSNGWEIVSAIILFGLALAVFFAAAKSSSEAASEQERIATESLYVISPYRIETLRQVKAPKDVTELLKTMVRRDFMTQDQLLRELRIELGSDRTSEIREIVLKYTRVDPEASLTT